MKARVHVTLKPGVLDPQGKAIAQALGRLGFDGVVMSDALDMGAVSGRRTPAVQVLRAGSDVVLMPPDPAATRTASSNSAYKVSSSIPCSDAASRMSWKGASRQPTQYMRLRATTGISSG